VLIENSILFGSKAFAADQNSKPVQVQNSDYSADVSSADDSSAGDSSGYHDSGGNISAAPVFVDAGSGNYREAGTSPTIDAGVSDPALSAADLDGNARMLGSAPDMGAYEFVVGGAPPSEPVPTPTTTGETPVYGTSVVLAPVSGVVTVEIPHIKGFQTLTAGKAVPVGSVIDARHGAVALTSAIDRQGTSRTGNFHGGRFVVRQSDTGTGRTELSLRGGSFAACRRLHRHRHSHRLTFGVMARAAGHPKHHHVVRQLWGSDSGGNFTTVGRNASAAVRGTVWLTQDRCDGTLIKVFKGHVVVRARHRHTITLGPGQSYLARTRP
jgi:hypothetical protein